jgi:hypothetical protein
MELHHQAEAAVKIAAVIVRRRLREIISAAEHRLAVALAVVEGDDGDDAA